MHLFLIKFFDSIILTEKLILDLSNVSQVQCVSFIVFERGTSLKFPLVTRLNYYVDKCEQEHNTRAHFKHRHNAR